MKCGKCSSGMTSVRGAQAEIPGAWGVEGDASEDMVIELGFEKK